LAKSKFVWNFLKYSLVIYFGNLSNLKNYSDFNLKFLEQLRETLSNFEQQLLRNLLNRVTCRKKSFIERTNLLKNYPNLNSIAPFFRRQKLLGISKRSQYQMRITQIIRNY